MEVNATGNDATAGACPAEFFDGYCGGDGWVEPDLGRLPVLISTVSCSASCLGSALIVLSFALWKDVRTGLRKIVTCLAIADFFTAAGYLLGNANYLHYARNVASDELGACSLFDCVCQIQAFVTSWSSYCSFIWTAIVAGYLYLALVKGDPKSSGDYFVLYHVVAWAAPLLVMLPLLCTGSLGYSPFASGGWCFIATDYSGEEGSDGPTYAVLNLKTVGLIFAGGKAVEISTYILVIVLYGKIQCSIRKKARPVISGVARKAEHTLFLIPVIFILLRIWGTVQFLFSIIIYCARWVDPEGCVPKPVYYVYLILTCAEALGDGGQGWGNSIIYIFWTKTIRQRLIVLPLKSCCLAFLNHIHLPSDVVTLSQPRPNQERQGLVARNEHLHNSASYLAGHVQGLEASLSSQSFSSGITTSLYGATDTL